MLPRPFRYINSVMIKHLCAAQPPVVKLMPLGFNSTCKLCQSHVGALRIRERQATPHGLGVGGGFRCVELEGKMVITVQLM